MSMFPGPRGMGHVTHANNGIERVNDLMAQVRSEFESQLRATESFEHQSKPPDPSSANVVQPARRLT